MSLLASTHRHLVQAVYRLALVALLNCLAEYLLQIYKFLIKILFSYFKRSLISVCHIS